MGCGNSKSVTDPPSKGGSTKCGEHLKHPEELVGFPEFPEGTTSLVSKHLTKEVWEMYKNESDAYGVPFKTCVFSGC